MSFLEIEGLVKHFPGAVSPAVSDIHLSLRQGEVLALLGPSGCGKTTLLRMIAGLEQADAGQLRLRDEDMTARPAHLRGFGMMFQDFALFPHQNVEKNIGFGLEMAGWANKKRQDRVDELLRLVDLQGYGSRSVFSLSGGEKQRVALARCLAPEPSLLMLDEPLASLDRRLREDLTSQLRAILSEMGQTAIYVTHDQREAFAIADRVAVMNQGRIEQIAAPEALYGRPASAFVARFLGLGNLLEARVVDWAGREVESPIGRVSLPSSAWQSVTGLESGGATADKESDGKDICLLVRPDAALPQESASAAMIRISGRVVERHFEGTRSRFTLALTESVQSLELEWPARYAGEGIPLARPGEAFACALDPAMMVLVPS
jgi:ABC-type Fe3+/spermidine/putrescine transport system ATPase subunit